MIFENPSFLSGRKLLTILFPLAFAGLLALPVHAAPQWLPDWSRLLEEKHIPTFVNELQKVRGCVVVEKVDVWNLPEQKDELTNCETRVWNIVSYKDKYGMNLLHAYLRETEVNLQGQISNIVNTFSMHDKLVVVLLGNLGITVFDWAQEHKDTDNALFVAARYGKLQLVDGLLRDLKNGRPEKLKAVAKMRSKDGESLANTLIAKFPGSTDVSSMITSYGLAKTMSEIKVKEGYLHTLLSVQLPKSQDEL